MGVEQISKINIDTINTNDQEKINKINTSLKDIKNIEEIDTNTALDATDRNDLKNKLLNIKIPWDGDIAEAGIKYLLTPTVDTIMEQYDKFINDGVGTIKDFLTEKSGYIQNIFSSNINVQDLKVRHFVDTVYSVGYSFEKQGGKYKVINPKGNTTIPLSITSSVTGNTTDPLDAINNDPKLVDTLDESLVERSFTGQGFNIKEMNLILQEIGGVSLENKESLNKITPENLAQAYLTYYAKKLKYSPTNPVPKLNNATDITTFLNDHKVSLKIPNERVTYIKLVQKNALGTGTTDSTEHDTEILRNIMSDYSKIQIGTGKELQVMKEAASSVGGMLKEGVPGLMKYMNGPEGLVLAAGLIYALFFSDFKKEAWLGIIGFTGLNVLTKAYNQDNNKGIIQSVASGLEGIASHDVQLPKALTGIEQESWLKDTNNSKINTLSIISSINFNTIMTNSKVNGNGQLIEMTDYNDFSVMDKKELEKLWPAGDWKKEVNKLLTVFIKETASNTGVTSGKLEEEKTALETKYKGVKYDNPSLSYVIADVLLWNATTTPVVAGGTTGTAPVAPIAAPVLSNIPSDIQGELDQIADIPTRNNLAQNISQVINGFYTKTALIADIDGQIGLPFITSTEKVALQNLKIKINTL